METQRASTDYFATGRGMKYCDQCVYMSVSMSVCSHITKNHTFKLH